MDSKNVDAGLATFVFSVEKKKVYFGIGLATFMAVGILVGVCGTMMWLASAIRW